MSATPQGVQALIDSAVASLEKVTSRYAPTGKNWAPALADLAAARAEAGQLIAPAPPAPPPTPPPSPGAAPAFMGPWFDPSSPWRTPIPAGVPIHPDTPQMVGGVYIGTDYSSDDIHAFVYRVQEMLAKIGVVAPPWNAANVVKWAGPGHQENVIYSPNGTPTIPVVMDTPTLGAAVLQVPMPQNWTGYNSPGVKAPTYYERRTTVVCENGDLWYLYGLTPPGDPLRDNPSTTDSSRWHGSHVEKDSHGGWKGVNPAFDAGGSGMPTFSGTVTPYDILNTPVGGHFGHALAFNAAWAADGSYPGHPKLLWPADAYGDHPLTDGRTKTGVGIPHGARIFWPATTDAAMEAIGMTKEWMLQIARTGQVYGGMSRESTTGQGSAGGIICESNESIAWNVAHGFYPAGFQWPWIADGTCSGDLNSSTYNAAFPAAYVAEVLVVDWTKDVPGITAAA